MACFPPRGCANLISDNLPPGVTTFGQLKIPCYLTAVDLRSKRLFLFGEDPESSVLDGMMASSVIPVLQPPLDYHGLQLVDGGVLAEVPCSVAMDKGATTIYAINVGGGEEVQEPVHGIFNILMRTLESWLVQSFFLDLQRADADPRIDLHHIHITAFSDLSFNDFSQDRRAVRGRQAGGRSLPGQSDAPRAGAIPGSSRGRVCACPVPQIRVAAASVSGITRHGKPINQPSKPRTPQLADAAGELLLYRVSWGEKEDDPVSTESIFRIALRTGGLLPKS